MASSSSAAPVRIAPSILAADFARLGEEVRAFFGGLNGASMRTSRGGGSPAACREQHARLMQRLETDRGRRAGQRA